MPDVPDVPDVPAAVTLHLWGVRRAAVAGALLAMARDRRPLRSQPGLRFGKLLGTGSGRTFTVRDADPRHWGVLACWDTPVAAEAFEGSQVVRGWDARCDERLRLVLSPLRSRGRWSGRQPFGDPAGSAHDGPVAALTRARIRPGMWRTFWGSVPPVAVDLRAAPGLMLALGVGEAPVGLQGTFSLWSSHAALAEFAYRGPAHSEAIRRTHELGWYAEELFARFAVRSADGTYAGTTVRLPGT